MLKKHYNLHDFSETFSINLLNEKPIQGMIIDQPSTHLSFKIRSSEGKDDKISSIESSKGFSISPSILMVQGFVLKFCELIYGTYQSNPIIIFIFLKHFRNCFTRWK